EADLTGIIDSFSWRVTAPLRSAKRDIRGVRRLAWRARMARGRRRPVAAAPRPAPDLAQLHTQPLVSIVTPVFETDPEWLRRAVDSVRAQTYPHWQLCLADDGSTRAETLTYLHSLEGEPAIEVSFGENGGIAAATNR